MENFSYHVPVYVVTGGIDQSGHSSELAAGQVGLFDRSTFSVATASGNGKEFFFAQGAIGGKDWYGQPVSESHKSPFFFGKDVEDMYVSFPQTIQNEEWVIGYNGAASSKSLKFEKGKAVRVRLYFHGEPTYRFYGGPKEYVISYTPEVDCVEPCAAGDCPEDIVDCLVHSQALVDNINNHVELQKFGVKAKLVNAPFTAGVANMEKYKLSVVDNGDAQALQAVQAQYPLLSISRIDRVGSVSSYQFCQPDAGSAPADFTQSGSVSLAVCGTCPVGSTLVSGYNTYYVSRPLAGTEDLVGASAAYATTIGTAYEVGTVKTFDGTVAGVDVALNTITVTAHGFATGDKVTYSNGGGTSITGITTATDYYVISAGANTIKLATTSALAFAGTAIDLTVVGVGVAHTLTPVITASYVGQNGSTATVKLVTPAGVELTALLSDTVELGYSVGPVCQFSAPAATAWVADGVGISSSRTMKISALQRLDCSGGDRLADLTSILAGVAGINIGTLTKIAGDGCADDYTVTQNSIDCLPEDCLTNNVTFTYDELPAYENHSWELVPVVPAEEPTRKCGIRISAGYIDPKFGNCSFDPLDFYETMPLKMEVSLLVEDASNCDASLFPSQQQTKIGRISRQSGEAVVRELIMKTDAYIKHVDQYSSDPRMREAFDQNLLGMVDRKAFYKIYYVTFAASYGAYTFRKNEQEKFTAMFIFKENDTNAATFESSILDVLTAKSGAALKVSS